MNQIIIPKPTIRAELTEKREYAILKDVQFIGTIAQLVENRWRNNLFDSNIKDQTLKNFSAQIYKGAQGVKNSLKGKFNLKEPDELEFELATSMDRVVSFFCLLPSELVNSIMDKLEAEKRALELEHAKVQPMEVQKNVYDIAPEQHEVVY
ncbi:hypothetical protein [Sphingobacterium hungaricum]|uniref:Uncharacterized protein n=1 Tax=Sphingobacterium hungaricum TaxID=2082723 RepID=A0A928YP47_9SPHI|nr:hypothetical protein [Sphingobacterium hungaricum]MBE8712559.1 hypothetical protein [Sphingobacterium hungaricum]